MGCPWKDFAHTESSAAFKYLCSCVWITDSWQTTSARAFNEDIAKGEDVGTRLRGSIVWVREEGAEAVGRRVRRTPWGLGLPGPKSRHRSASRCRNSALVCQVDWVMCEWCLAERNSTLRILYTEYLTVKLRDDLYLYELWELRSSVF